MSDPDLHYDFGGLLNAGSDLLLSELADCHTALANLAVQIAYLKSEEIRQTEGARIRRFEAEGLEKAYTEKKWLIKTLLDYAF